MDWWGDWIQLGRWWTTTFGFWSWETAWSAAGVVANVGLGYVALKALKEAQRQANAADEQAHALRTQTEADRRRETDLLKPSLFVAIRPKDGGRGALMIMNCSAHPIVFGEGMSFLRENSTGFLEIQFVPLNTSALRPLNPGEEIYLFEGGYQHWNTSITCKRGWYDGPSFIKHLGGDVDIYVDSNGKKIHESIRKRGWADGKYVLALPFTYIAPGASEYFLYATLELSSLYETISLVTHEIALADGSATYVGKVATVGNSSAAAPVPTPQSL